MQATKYGPAGYDYQYLASLYIILFFTHDQNVDEIYIDRLDLEDLMLSIINPVSKKKERIEYEFKKRTSAFDKEFFIKCISKFTAGTDNEYILSKLEKGQTEKFYIFTSARADHFSEECQIIANNATLSKPISKRTKRIIKDLKKSIIDLHSKSADVKSNFIVSHISSLSEEQLDSIMDKIFIIDQHDSDYVYQRISDLLTLRKIATSSHDVIIHKLIDIIKAHRVSGVNIILLINEILESYRTRPPALTASYLQMGDEKALFDELKEKKLLLLTGTTLCGKTQKAYYLINKLINESPSIFYQPATDIRTAEHFLFDNATEGRICYLEDPLGQYLHDGNRALYKQLENLVRNLPANRERYLICTSTEEVIASFQTSSYLPEFHWHDLSVKDRSFLQTMWSELTKKYVGLFGQPRKVVSQTIEVVSEQDLLQPGQLVHLARNMNDLKLSTIDEVKHAANFRAHDITNSLAQKESSVVQCMQIMGIGASTQTGLNDNELTYIVEDDEAYLPGINQFQTRSTGSSFFGTIPEIEYKIKQYRDFKAGIGLYRNALATLIDLGYIIYSNSEYLFSHPIYHEAARNLLSGNNPIRFNEAIRQTRKSIGCLNAKVALQSVKNLYLLINGTINIDQQIAVIHLAETGLDSTFVTVRDSCVLFLVNNYQHLNSEQRDKLREHFEHRIDFSTENYYWQDEVAFIPDEEHLVQKWRSYDDYKSRKDIIISWTTFLEDRPTLNSREAIMLLKSLIIATKGVKKRIAYDIAALKYFLRFDEAFIRERAAFLIAASITDDTINELKEIYFENDPYVKFQFIKGLFRSWPYIKEKEKQDDLLNFMLTAFDEPFVVLSAIQLFTQFASGHSSAAFDWKYDIEKSIEKKMWYLWGEFMVVLFKHLPTDVRINSGRFDSALYEAKISINAKTKIIHAYLDWLVIYLEDKDYRTNMSDSLLSFFSFNFEKISSNKRFNLIKRFLSVPVAIFQAKAIGLFVLNWVSLSQKEKSYIISTIPTLPQIARIVAFTTKDSTSEVQHAAIGYTIRGKNVCEIVLEMPEMILLQLLNSVYIYYPTKDIDDRDVATWNEVLKYYIDKPSSQGYSIALKVFFDDILTWRNTRNGLWNNPRQILYDALSSQTNSNLMIVFNMLLEFLVEVRHAEVGPYLNVLYEKSPADIRISFASKLCHYIEAISYEENLHIIPPSLLKDCISTLYYDEAILHMLNPKFYDGDEGKAYEAFAEMTMMHIEMKKIRSHIAIMTFRNWIKQKPHLFDSCQQEQIEDYLSYFHSTVMSQQKVIREENEQLFEQFIPNNN